MGPAERRRSRAVLDAPRMSRNVTLRPVFEIVVTKPAASSGNDLASRNRASLRGPEARNSSTVAPLRRDERNSMILQNIWNPPYLRYHLRRAMASYISIMLYKLKSYIKRHHLSPAICSRNRNRLAAKCVRIWRRFMICVFDDENTWRRLKAKSSRQIIYRASWNGNALRGVTRMPWSGGWSRKLSK